MIPGAIYVRQSLTRDGSESMTIQLDTCREAAPRLGIDVLYEMVEPPSTSGFKNRGRDRAKFREMLDLVEARRIRAILVYKSERLSRGGGPGWTPVVDVFERAGMDFNRAIATPSGWMSEFEIGIRAAMDREESKKLSDRMRDVRAREARQGAPRQGGLRPFGYDADLVTVIKPEADLIREAAGRVLAGETAWAVARSWNQRGLTTSTGGHWGAQTIRRMLTSGRVAGLREHNGEIVADADWPAIIERPVWEAVRHRVERPATVHAVKARTFLLNGFVFCGRCGNRMQTRTRTIGDRRRREYTCQAPESSGQATSCNGCVIHADPVEEDVYRRVAAAVCDPAFREFMAAAPPDDAAALGLELAAIDARRERLTELYVEGDITKAAYRDRAAALEDEAADLRRQLNGGAALSLPLASPETFRSEWDSRDLGWRRQVVALLVERIDVRPGRMQNPADRLGYRWTAAVAEP